MVSEWLVSGGSATLCLSDALSMNFEWKTAVQFAPTESTESRIC